jgi:hypothetical protein
VLVKKKFSMRDLWCLIAPRPRPFKQQEQSKNL